MLADHDRASRAAGLIITTASAPLAGGRAGAEQTRTGRRRDAADGNRAEIVKGIGASSPRENNELVGLVRLARLFAQAHGAKPAAFLL